LSSNQTKDSIIILEPELNADFKLDTAPTYEEYEAPLKINLKNNSQGNTTNKWTFTGADLSSSTDKDPNILFTKAGSYSISLEVSNGKKTKTFTKDITVNPSKGFYFIKDLKLGISSAQASIGAVFSSSIRKIFKENDKTTKLEAEQIDFAFFGLDSDFSYNQFVSPNTMADAGFDAIANTTKTKILNKQNLLSADDFGKLTLDKLKSLDIKNYNEISKYFGSATPHVVLYETQNGRKGAILIKQQVKDKDNSYIIVDVKIIK
jgi:PKD repeat protein